MEDGWVIIDKYGNRKPYSKGNIAEALKAPALRPNECNCPGAQPLGYDHCPSTGVCGCGVHTAHTHCATCGGIIELR